MMIQIDVESGRVLQRLGDDKPRSEGSPAEAPGFAPTLQCLNDTRVTDAHAAPPEMLAPGDIDARLERIQGLHSFAECL